jgi:hypothetical protein
MEVIRQGIEVKDPEAVDEVLEPGEPYVVRALFEEEQERASWIGAERRSLACITVQPHPAGLREEEGRAVDGDFLAADDPRAGLAVVLHLEHVEVTSDLSSQRGMTHFGGLDLELEPLDIARVPPGQRRRGQGLVHGGAELHEVLDGLEHLEHGALSRSVVPDQEVGLLGMELEVDQAAVVVGVDALEHGGGPAGEHASMRRPGRAPTGDQGARTTAGLRRGGRRRGSVTVSEGPALLYGFASFMTCVSVVQ